MMTWVHTPGDRRSPTGRDHGLAHSGLAAAARTSSPCLARGLCAGHCSSRRPDLVGRPQLEEKKWMLQPLDLGWAHAAGRGPSLGSCDWMGYSWGTEWVPTYHPRGRTGCVLLHHMTTTTTRTHS
jgi:hypothetical protein